MYAYMLWADTTAGIMKMRNGANSAWISLWELDGTFIATDISLGAGTAGAPSLYFTGDTNTGIYSPGADQVAISTGGTGRLFVSSAGLVGIGNSDPRGIVHVGADLSSGATDAAAINIKQTSTTATTGIYLERSGARTGYYIHIGGDQDSLTFRRNYVGTKSDVMSLTRDGLVGIGTTSPGDVLDTAAGSYRGITIKCGTTAHRPTLSFFNTTDSLAAYIQATGSSLAFGTMATDYGSHSEKVRIDSSGRLLVGTSTARTNFNTGAEQSHIQLEGTTFNTTNLSIVRNSANDGTAALTLGKSRSATVNGNTVVVSGDPLGFINFEGADGTNMVRGASIAAQVDGTPGANDMPGRLVFSTCGDGSASPTERMRISSDGTILFVKTSASFSVAGVDILNDGQLRTTRSGASPIAVNRTTNDGDLVEFYQAGTLEGTISVSGTTVSYNGAHLSRWSQLPSGAERTEILRGSVLSNIDEMCEWTDEENEQLNRMQVSDVEGDKNVSGVFQAWDDDDDTYTNDFYCAMTGDFIIRIAEGVTVERGDLLMSAGDGTAKPQDDDIIRSKTIAKVTSTNVSCTYPDGSYCVPCVLMAC